MDAATIAVLIRLNDQLSGPMRQAAQSIDAVKAPTAGAAQALNSLESEAGQATRAVAGIEGPTRQAAEGMSLMKASFLGFSLGAVVTQAPSILKGIGQATFMAASDTTEAMNKVEAVFKENAGVITKWAGDSATSFGLSKAATLEYAGTFGNLLTAMELPIPVATEMSQGIVQLAADLGSFNNMGTDEVLEKLRAGLVGEIEPLRTLGVNLTAATVQAKAMEMGLADNVKELTAADKAQASYALILEQTTTAQGDYARNASEASNSMKTLGAHVADASARVGGFLLLIGGPVIAFAAQNFEALAAGIGGALLVALGAATPAMIGFATATWAAMAPFLPFIAAAAALGVAIFALVKYWDPLVERFPIIQQGVDKVREAFQFLIDFVGGAIPGFMSMIGGVATAFVEWFTLPLEVIAGLGRAMWRLFHGDFEGAWEAASGTIGTIRESFGNMKDGILQAMDGITSGVQDGWDNATKSTEEFIGPVLIIGPLLSELSNNVGVFRDALARQAELAGIANERNMEYFHTLELGSGATAQAAFDLAKLSEAADSAWQGQQNLNAMWSQANEALGFWEGNLKQAETALDILTRQQEQNGGLTEEQQRQYDLLTEAQQRYKGGVEDSEGAVVNAAVAQAEFIRIQDDLNARLASGELSAGDYAREMANLTAETDPAASSAYGLAGAQGDLQLAIEGVVNKLGNLLIDLGLLPESKRTEFQTPGMQDAQQNVDTLKSKMGEVPDSMVITAHVDILQAQNALNELRGMTFTQSPPKKGPMAFVPNWNYLFEGLVESAENYGSQAMERLRSFLKGIDLDSIMDRQTDLAGDIANLTTVRDAMAEIGDTEAVEALNAELERLSAEAENLAGIIGTDAVEAWLRHENALQAQAEAAERVREVQEAIVQATQTAVMVLSEGGNAASSYFERIVGAFDNAKAALDMAVLLGLSPEVIAGLQEDFDEAALIYEAGAEQLQAALLAGMIDEETLAALADAGGEWFRQLYDSLFGEGALAKWQAGLDKLVEKTAYTGRVAASAITGELGGGGSAFSSASSAARALSAEASSAIRAAGAAANQTGYIIGPRPTAIADAEIAEIRAALSAASSLNEKVSLAYHLKILLENRDRDLANLDLNSDGAVTQDEILQYNRNKQAAKMERAYATGPGSEAGVMAGWGGGAPSLQAAVSDGIVDGHRRVVTGSRRSTSLVGG